jgi:hypothetical protein
MAITITSDSATISTTEYFLASDSTTATYQTADLGLEVWLDLSNLALNDDFRVRVYEKVNNGTARTVYDTTFSDAQDPPIKRIEVGLVGEGWEVSIQRTGGSDRSIAWSLRQAA